VVLCFIIIAIYGYIASRHKQILATSWNGLTERVINDIWADYVSPYISRVVLSDF
jgi:hypothetical protein